MFKPPVYDEISYQMEIYKTDEKKRKRRESPENPEDPENREIEKTQNLKTQISKLKQSFPERTKRAESYVYQHKSWLQKPAPIHAPIYAHEIPNFNKREMLWLWELHNSVNERLSGSLTDDPKIPKFQYPTQYACGECHTSYSSALPEKFNKEYDELKVYRVVLQKCHGNASKCPKIAKNDLKRPEMT